MSINSGFIFNSLCKINRFPSRITPISCNYLNSISYSFIYISNPL